MNIHRLRSYVVLETFCQTFREAEDQASDLIAVVASQFVMCGLKRFQDRIESPDKTKTITYAETASDLIKELQRCIDDLTQCIERTRH